MAASSSPGVRITDDTIHIEVPGVFADGFLDGTGYAQGEREGYPALLSDVFDNAQYIRRGRGSSTRMSFPLNHDQTRESIEELREFAATLLGLTNPNPEPEERAQIRGAMETIDRCNFALTFLNRRGQQTPDQP